MPKFRTFTATSKSRKDRKRKFYESKGTDYNQNLKSGLPYWSLGKKSLSDCG